MLKRREFLSGGLLAGAVLSFGPSFWRRTFEAMAVPNRVADGPYGPLGPPDVNGIRLPAGFRSRVIAQAGEPVRGTGYYWPVFPDGAACFDAGDGGWILVVNTENPPDVNVTIPVAPQGGASAIRFRADGSVEDAYRILDGTNTNCAGGPTPWGTWLSCEEFSSGQVWECDPMGRRRGVAIPAMGRFEHEAAAVDGPGRRVYLSEDNREGGFYRYTPSAWPSLREGRLEVASVRGDGSVRWIELPDPSAARQPTRQQVPEMTRFQRGEGMWFDSGTVYLSTTVDHKVHAYNTVLETMDLLYDGQTLPGAPLTQVDNVTASPSGDVFVCEDTGGSDPLDIVLITPDGEVSRFLKVTGSQHTGGGGDASSELAGVTFDPSGSRMYFSSQRAYLTGITYEITGPFVTKRRVPRPLALRIAAPRTVSIRQFTRSGVPVEVTVDAPSKITVAVRARLARGRRRSRRVTLARSTHDVDPAGMVKLTLRAGRRSRSLLRGRSRVRATIEVLATDRAGTKSVASRMLGLRGRRRRRRR